MTEERILEQVRCPCCNGSSYNFWAEERGFNLVRCSGCRLLYVNPRPQCSAIEDAVRTGEHRINGKLINVRARRVARKVSVYRKLFAVLLEDRLRSYKPLVWLDVGAGYGEILEAVEPLLPDRSCAIGVEPMHHKAESAQKQGLQVVEGYLEFGQFRADVISMINIFSHIADFGAMLRIARSNLKENGELLIETGNLADLDNREQAPGILDLPDHLVFAGVPQMRRYLNDAGFDLVALRSIRVDGITTFTKNIIKYFLGRPALITFPYTSPYRQLILRARLFGPASLENDTERMEKTLSGADGG